MRIAVVGPSPVPYTRGGVENLLFGLCGAINKYTNHTAELIKIPIREDSAANILKAYWKFYRTRLDHFDLIISVKYPSWMIRHRNHMVYMCHRHRGLYDCYSDELVGSVDSRPLLKFPGPLIQKIIHKLDALAINPKWISDMFCISATVAARSEYFPNQMPPTVLHPPPILENFKTEPGSHFFTASRLDPPKRIDLLAKAYRTVKGDIPFYIAGDGPQRPQLQKLAEADQRIKLLGDISDDQLLDYYSKSIAILYAPYQEDYGYITIEAMESGKPVITASDAGGPLEFVQNGKTGLITDSNPMDLAGAIQTLADDQNLAGEMGLAAKEIVRHITWENTVVKLLAPYQYLPEKKQLPGDERLRILVLVPYPVFPPRSGGQRRVASIYGELARYYDVWLLSLNRTTGETKSTEVHRNLHEICIPLSQKHAAEQWELEKSIEIAISDAALPSLLESSPNYLRILHYLMDCSDIIVSAQPYLHPFIKQTKRTRMIVHDSQNFEYELKKQSLGHHPTGRKLLNSVKEAEKKAVCESQLFLATSNDEGQQILDYYQTR